MSEEIKDEVKEEAVEEVKEAVDEVKEEVSKEEPKAEEKPAAEEPKVEQPKPAEPEKKQIPVGSQIPPEPKKKKKGWIGVLVGILAVALIGIVLILVIALAILIPTVIKPAIENQRAYKEATEMLNSAQYDEAMVAFTQLGDYKDSQDMVYECYYLKAEDYYRGGEYFNAITWWESIPFYKDSEDRAKQAQEEWNEEEYQAALSLMNSGDYDGAKDAFSKLGSYKDSSSKVTECEELKLKDAYDAAVAYMDSKDYANAIAIFEALGDYSDCAQKIIDCKVAYVKSHKKASDSTTTAYLNDLFDAGYGDAQKLSNEIYGWTFKLKSVESSTSTKGKSSFKKDENWYFRLEVSGKKGKKVKLSYMGYYPDGSTAGDEWDGQFENGAVGTVWFYYSIPSAGKTGDFTVKIQDENKNTVAQTTVTITD